MKGKFPTQFIKLLLKLQSWTKYLRQTLVFMSNRALGEAIYQYLKKFHIGKRTGR